MAEETEAPTGFLSRWSRRKSQLRQGVAPAAEPVPAKPAPAALTAAAPKAQTVDGAVDRGIAAQPAAAGGGPVTDRHPAPGQPVAEAPAAVDPAPSLADANALAAGADVRRFVAPDVLPEVRNAALKRLFADPHFNLMDGLDTYIDDYGKPDPLPPGMLRQMAQASFLRLFDDAPPVQPDAAASAQPDGAAQAAESTAPGAAENPAAMPPPQQQRPSDEDPELRLQPNDAAGPGRSAPGAGPDAGGER